MLFTAATVLAFASAALAQVAGFDAITSPPNGSTIAAGSTYEIDWEPTTHLTETVSIKLIGGKTQGTQTPLSTIATGIVNSVGKYSWAVDPTLGSLPVYGLQIVLDSDPKTFQYSFPFAITGGKATSSSTTSASGSGSSSTTSGSASSASGAASSSSTTSATGASTTAAQTTSTTTAAAPSTTLTTSVVVPAGNLSTTATATKTKTQVVGASTTTTTGSSSIATGAANNYGASSLAFLGGVALAVLAL